jgi:spore germination protein YaaH
MRNFVIFLLWASLPALAVNALPSRERSVPQPQPEAEIVDEAEFEEPIIVLDAASLPISTFREVWGYVVSGREDGWRADMPVSDIAYFGAGVNVYGQLVGVPNPNNIPNFNGRMHLVVTCAGQALSHFALLEGTPTRRQLITDLVRATEPFYGLQINFEDVPARSGDAFRSFLEELRRELPDDKMFSIAIAARTRTLANDVYDYSRIVHLFDRMLVMGYDEHWGGGNPGPIASMNWSRNVAAYSLRVIGADKLVMGLPFYGRSWGSWTPGRAHIYADIARIRQEQGITEVRRDNGIPTFTYTAPITATVYYEDAVSLSTRMEMYRNMGVRSIGFWRIGQETPEVWNHIRLEE